jgi:hypothetical protein
LPALFLEVVVELVFSVVFATGPSGFRAGFFAVDVAIALLISQILYLELLVIRKCQFI